MKHNRKLVRGFAVVALFTALAGDALRYSITWYGWTAVALGLTVIAIVLLVRTRARWRISTLPFPLIAFVVLAFVSTAWSSYPLWSAAGAFSTLITVIIAAALAIALTRDELLWALGIALRLILGLSLLFELVISVFVRQPILPWWVDYGGQKIYAAYYWSRDLLFTGDRIQGIVGNSNLLGFVALLGLIVFAVQLASRRVRLGWGTFWLVIAAAGLALTRSATVTVALVAVVAVAIILVLVRRARTTRGRVTVSVVSLIIVAAGIVTALLKSTVVFELLGKSDSLTGRTGIWSAVVSLADQRPGVGWGWISYWFPTIAPFNNKKFVIHGVQYLQAHDAWLDVWFQLGIVGLVVFGALVLSTVVRSWLIAVEVPATAGTRGLASASTLLPVLILVALLAQSLTESRLLIEYGMLLLTLFAIRSKRDLQEPVAP